MHHKGAKAGTPARFHEDMLTELQCVVTVTALSPLELWPSPLVVVATELAPPADESSDVELLGTCPLPFELAVLVACSPDGFPPALQAHARTHANRLC